MTAEELRARLQDEGVVLLRDLFVPELLIRLREAASRCFAAIATGRILPERYRFIPQAHSLLLAALLDFGVESEAALKAPLSSDLLRNLFAYLVGDQWRCRLEHSWVRKKFAPPNAPPTGYYRQDWHQDGALGAGFHLEPGPPLPPRPMATCWIPLDACGTSRPGLEFIRKPQPALLHFTELDDALLRRRFDAAAFWAPALEFGDALVFRSDALHRTHVTGDMRDDRMSVEYRIFQEES